MSRFFPRNLRLQALREMDESLREALDTAKTEASQSTAALAQAQARETILAADVECKVMACAAAAPCILVSSCDPPPPPSPAPGSGGADYAFFYQRTRGDAEAAEGGGKEGWTARCRRCLWGPKLHLLRRVTNA